MELLQKIKDHEAVIGVVGLGYVGLPLLLEFVQEKFPTIGFDIDPAKIPNGLKMRLRRNCSGQQVILVN
jgi:UDP-N-acetyl-D-mannosaminuronate dehydrogenase